MIILWHPTPRHPRGTPKEAIEACEDLKIMAESEEAGVLLCMAENGKKILVMSDHPEYDRLTPEKDPGEIRTRVWISRFRRIIFPNDDDTERPAADVEGACQYTVHKLAQLLCLSAHSVCMGGR